MTEVCYCRTKLGQEELDGKMHGQTEVPDSQGLADVWRKIWYEPVEHNRNSEC